MPIRNVAIAAIVFRTMIESGEHVAHAVVNLSNLFCIHSGIAANEAGKVAAQVIDGDPYNLALFVTRATARRGWGRSLRVAVGRALNRVELDTILTEIDRPLGAGLTLREIIRKSHPRSSNENRARVYRDAARGL